MRQELSCVVQDVELTAAALAIEAEMDDDGELKDLIQGVVDEVESSLARLSKSVRRFGRALRDRPEKLVVALFGRTMAGKSTLAETLAGGSGEAIGEGGQRTTRETRYCDWGDVVLLDTPGIGAFKGEKDARIARRDVRDADLVVFVLTDDSIQDEVFHGFEHVREENKPVLFILNTKLDINRAVFRKRFLRDPSAFLGPEALSGHLDRLDELARERLGISDYRVVAVHAQAAWVGVREGHPALLNASGVLEVVSAITGLVSTDAVTLRVRSTFDPSIVEIERVGDKLASLRDDIREQQRIYVHRAEVLHDRLRQISRTHATRVSRTVSAHVAPKRHDLQEWVDSNIGRRDVEASFERWLEFDKLQEALQQDLESAATQIEEACQDAIDRLEVDLREHFQAVLGIQPFHRIDWRSHLTNLRRAVLVVSAAMRVYRTLRVARAAAASTVVGIALLAALEGLALAARRFPNINVARRAYVARVTRKIDAKLKNLASEVTAEASVPISDAITQGAVGQLQRSLEGGGQTLGRVAKVLSAGAVAVRRSSNTLGGALCGALLSADDGGAIEIWGRLPGRLVCPRQPLQQSSRQRLERALNERVKVLEGPRTNALRALFGQGSRVSWRQDTVLIRTAAGQDIADQTALAELIAERGVVIEEIAEGR